MHKKPLKTILGTLFLSLSTTAVAQAQSSAEDFPTKPVRLIVAAASGSSPDSISRLLADKLGEKWGQPVVIENMDGLGGILGTERASRQSNDGYTMLVSTIGAMSIGNSIMDNFPYDPVEDFDPVTLVMSMPNLLVVHPDVPVDNLTELITYTKENPEQLRYGHPGIGTTPHLSAELLLQMADLKMQGIPYKSSAQMATDLLGGHYEVLFHNSSVMLPYAKSGQARPLGITSAQRLSDLPDMPTVAEAGDLDGFEINAWWGMYMPAGAPEDITTKISADVNEVLAQADVTKWIETRGGTVGGGDPEALRTHQAEETKKWRELIKAANIQSPE